MGIFADIIVILIIITTAFIGYKKGLIKVAIKMVAFLIAIIVSLILYKPLSNIVINNTQIDDNIKNTIIEKITPEGLSKEDKVTSSAKISSKIVDTTNNSIENIAETLTIKIIQISILLLLFIIIRILLVFITALADLIAKIPILKQFNETGGLIYGLLKGILIVYVVFGILLLIDPLVGNEISNTLNSSIIAKTIYNNNILINVFL